MNIKIFGVILTILLLIISTVPNFSTTTIKGLSNAYTTTFCDDAKNIVNKNLKICFNELPLQWDWRNVDGKDWTTPIKDQLQDVCGSCWAFGALGGFEAVIKIWENNPDLDVDLSEQFMVSCSPGSCEGWNWLSTLRWVKNNGAIPESCLPYQADDTIPCEAKCPEWRDYLIGIDDYKKVSVDFDSIKEALVEYGPLPASMTVYEDFYPNYQGGVYKYTYGDLVFGHCVTIVGYDDTWGGEDEGYWIVKNSWGTGWGEDGWFKIAYGECDIEKAVYYLTGPNYAPETPEKPVGPNRGTPGNENTYFAFGSDPDQDRIKFGFDWGDGDETWSSYVEPGETVYVNHSWITNGNYEIRVKSKDEHGLESDWSEPLSIKIPKNKLYSFQKILYDMISNININLNYYFLMEIFNIP